MLTLADSPAEAAFREEIGRWTASLPTGLRWSERHEDLLEVDRALAAARLLGVSWPKEYGGRGSPAGHEAVLTEELGKVGVRRSVAPSHQGVNNLAPALMAFGRDDQKLAHLPKILGVQEIWCQGFSEPEAGSDLANIQTTAVSAGDSLVINGSKLWTSGAQYADWIYLLVRTGGPKSRHKGLSFVLAPMNEGSVTVRPIRQLTGSSEFCEVILEELVVPQANVLGRFNEGWSVAMALLGAERLSGRYRYATFRRELRDLVQGINDGSRGVLPEVFARDLGRVAAGIEGMGCLSLRIDSLRQSGKEAGSLPSVNKLWWPRAHQELHELGLRASAEFRLDPAIWYRGWLESRAESIYGGTAQVQRNILAERFLGLPRGR
jgi:alkylation response protein AidB-like acyl-CoA dehydrogenase